MDSDVERMIVGFEKCSVSIIKGNYICQIRIRCCVSQTKFLNNLIFRIIDMCVYNFLKFLLILTNTSQKNEWFVYKLFLCNYANTFLSVAVL